MLNHHDRILMEAAVVERVRRSPEVTLHPTLANAPLIYDPVGAAVMKHMYHEYIAIADRAALPFLMCTPTWRANHERVKASNVPCTLNADAVGFMQEIRTSQASRHDPVFIGGMIGCRHDCYRPEEGLAVAEAEHFHAWQIHELAGAGVDLLIAETLPSVEEAIGIARAMAQTGLPYLISFVIARDGRVLDGTALPEAVARVDEAAPAHPLGYLINCAYPTFLCAQDQPRGLFQRLIGFQANASALDQAELEGAEQVRAEAVSAWGDAMLELNRDHGIRILGGCCGTGSDHLQYLADAWSRPGPPP